MLLPTTSGVPVARLGLFLGVSALITPIADLERFSFIPILSLSLSLLSSLSSLSSVRLAVAASSSRLLLRLSFSTYPLLLDRDIFLSPSPSFSLSLARALLRFIS